MNSGGCLSEWLVRVMAGLLVVAVAGCRSPRPAVELIVDRDVEPSRRVGAVHALGPMAREDADGRRALWQVVWSDREPVEVRAAAMQWLITIDDSTFWAAAATHVSSMASPTMLGRLCDRAVADRQVSMVGPLVRSWARPARTIADRDRPECGAIAALSGLADVEDALWAVLRDRAGGFTLAEQAAAWVVLCRLVGPVGAERGLDDGPGGSIVTLLQAHRSWLAPLPDSREQLRWLRVLDDAGRLPPRLPDGWHGGLGLRHLAALRHADMRRLGVGRGRWLAEVRAGLAGRPVHRRGAEDAEELFIAPQPERLADHEATLSRADLVVIATVMEVLGDPAVVTALFEQADADLADRTGEYGGAIQWEAGRWVARRYASSLRTDDRTFISPVALVEAMDTALAHYHFHAQRHDNAHFAGPGGGDLAFCRRTGYTCLVFTFVDRDTLAADLYQPDGVVLDLGEVWRGEEGTEGERKAGHARALRRQGRRGEMNRQGAVGAGTGGPDNGLAGGSGGRGAGPADRGGGMWHPSYQKLVCWRRSMDLVALVYRIGRRFPDSEKAGLAAAMKKAASAIPARIAEAEQAGSAEAAVRGLEAARQMLVELYNHALVARRVKVLGRRHLAQIRVRCQRLDGILDRDLDAIERWVEAEAVRAASRPRRLAAPGDGAVPGGAGFRGAA